MNSIKFVCPDCSRSMTLPAALEGKQGKCPKCGVVVTVVSEAGVYEELERKENGSNEKDNQEETIQDYLTELEDRDEIVKTDTVYKNCEWCGIEADTQRVTFHRNIGGIFVRFTDSHRGRLCKVCINKTFWSYTAVTLFLGWWGLFSFFITPIFLVRNLSQFAASRDLKKPEKLSLWLSWWFDKTAMAVIAPILLLVLSLTLLNFSTKSPEDYYNRGNVYYDQGELDKALTEYNKAIELNPTFSDAYLNRGLVYGQLGETDKELTDYNKTIELNPEEWIAYYNRGLVYGQLGETDKELADYNKTIELNPKEWRAYRAYLNRGIVYYNQSKLDKALTDYNKAIELNPTFADAYYSRGEVYYDQSELDKALTDYNKAIELNPTFANAYYSRGIVYYDQSELDKALTDYNKAIELNPLWGPIYYWRGLAFQQIGDAANAEADYAKAKELGYEPE